MSFSKQSSLLSCFMEWDMLFKIKKKGVFSFWKLRFMHFMLFEVLPHFKHSYFVSSWNQVGVFHWKLIPICVTVFSVTISLKHWGPNEEISVQKTWGKQKHLDCLCIEENNIKCILKRGFSTAGPWPSTGPWHQLYRAARGLRKLQYATRFHSCSW